MSITQLAICMTKLNHSQFALKTAYLLLFRVIFALELHISLIIVQLWLECMFILCLSRESLGIHCKPHFEGCNFGGSIRKRK